ncbi:hypothetical protein X798_00640 [Onchocerca flexuosa]|uniref:MRG domain-containing protein n=2 Tax=Onchocerca flexuosa TaxID=387005 RepID=A0A183HHA4_9BILA|nr:hypothetical protein X798_00640 [Onchocerca flexuosa]VDO48170.1 unnamed protein product [Onchocerca flexuosa]
MKCSCLGRKEISAGGTVRYCKSSAKSTADEFENPRIPPTRKQKFVSIKNWKGIKRDVTNAGIEMFLKMLSEHLEFYESYKFRNTANAAKEN